MTDDGLDPATLAGHVQELRRGTVVLASLAALRRSLAPVAGTGRRCSRRDTRSNACLMLSAVGSTVSRCGDGI
jgi:hypothetical protein